jgi:hypothetical protein
VPYSKHAQPLSEHLGGSNDNFRIEIVAGSEEPVSEALCTIAYENHLQGCEQEDVRQASRLDTQISIDRLEWVFVDQYHRQPKIDIRELRWNWVFPKDEEHRPSSRTFGLW